MTFSSFQCTHVDNQFPHLIPTFRRQLLFGSQNRNQQQLLRAATEDIYLTITCRKVFLRISLTAERADYLAIRESCITASADDLDADNTVDAEVVIGVTDLLVITS